MAESISEGTLKSWSKQVGDTVAADEEVATIETDKVSLPPYVTGYGPKNTFTRLMCLSTPLKLEKLSSCLQTRKIQ